MQVHPMQLQIQRPLSSSSSLSCSASIPISIPTSSSSMLPRHSLLSVVKQTSPFEERVTRNGIQRDIHVVIKNSPFIVQIAVLKACEVNLNHVAFEASLLYDTEGDKEVDYVKVKPVEYKCVPNEAGDQVCVELRIKVLTSQHEDMFFKVVIQGQDPVSKQDIPNLRVVTAPIKVISKPEQLKKRGGGGGVCGVGAGMGMGMLSSQPIPPSSSSSASSSKKRTVNDMVVEAVTRIEKQQAEQAIMMERLFAEISANKRPHHDMSGAAASWEIPLTRIVQPKEESADFETCFVQLLKSFSSIDPNHRAERVRRIARTLSVTDNENFSELVDMLTSEGLGQETVREARPMMNNTMYEKMDNVFFTSLMPTYGAPPTMLHNTITVPAGLNSSIDYGDFLGLGAHSPNGEFLM